MKKSILIFSLGCFFSSFLMGQVSIPDPYASISGVSSLRSWVASAPSVGVDSLKSRPLSQVKEIATYTDGLGRVIQTVRRNGALATGATPADLVAANVYDHFGRQTYSYLPFAANTAGGNGSLNDGEFKLNPFEQQLAFYSGTNSPVTGQEENFFYSEIQREHSPLGAVKKALRPGNNWVGSGRGETIGRYYNTVLDSVVMWKVTDSIVDNSFSKYYPDPYFGAPYYLPGSLGKSIVTNEDGKQVISYVNKEGLLVLKKVQNTAVADNGDGSGHRGWLCTYYIYDHRNNLHCIIQPEGVSQLLSQGLSVSQIIFGNDFINDNYGSSLVSYLDNAGFNSSSWSNVLNEQSFRYQYDYKNRIIRKKIPGSGEVLYVYDKRGRLVLTQDARVRGLHKWVYYTYDAFNRPYSSGLLTDEQHYNDISYHLDLAKDNDSYPDLSSYPTEELTRIGYDNYENFPHENAGFSTSYDSSHISHFSSNYNNPIFAEAPISTTNTKGLKTWVRIKVLGGGVDSIQYILVLYDKKNRPIQVKSNNVSGGVDVVSTQYDWAGKVLFSVAKISRGGSGSEVLTMITRNIYDDLGRLIRKEKKIGGTNVNGGALPTAYTAVSEVAYDALGRVIQKKIAPDYGGIGMPLETMNFDFNIHGWLLGVNRGFAKDENNANYFGFDLGYDKADNGLIGSQLYSNPSYIGNISGTVWKSRGDGEKRKFDYSYDASGRLLSADFNQYTGSSFNKSAGLNFSMFLGNGTMPDSAYDFNGNIRKLKQYGFKVMHPRLLMT